VTVIRRAALLAGDGERLTREPARDKVDPPNSGNSSHVVMAGDARPVLGDDCAAVGVPLAEGDGTHSGSFKPKAKAPDPAEQIEDIHGRPK
jgi:hypothetical protein